jgi:predicted  nucleic acid-binding Zn-ribbon protein
MPRIRIEVDGYRCTRCGHEWVPRKSEVPRVCPKCKSPFWDRERRLATHRIEAQLSARGGWAPDRRKLDSLERQLAALARVKKGGRRPEARSSGTGVRVSFNLQALSEGNAKIAAKAMIDGRVRDLGLRSAGYRSDVSTTQLPAD